MNRPNSILEFLKESNLIEGEDGGNVIQPLSAWMYLLGVNLGTLTHEHIWEAHKRLMLDKPYPDIRGQYRTVSVQVGGRLCPPPSVISGYMDNWLLDYQTLGWLQAHRRFESIHPFADGNGRLGRILLNWQRVKGGEAIQIIRHSNYADRQEIGYDEYMSWFK